MIQRLFTILVLFIILLHPQFIQADDCQYIEIFDPQQDKVVKNIPTNKDINNMVVDWINEIDGIYSAIDPITDDGYAIRFPLDPPIQVQNKWLDILVKEVYLLISEKEPTFFLILNLEDSPVCFLFPGEIVELSKILNFQLKLGYTFFYAIKNEVIYLREPLHGVLLMYIL